MQILSNPEVQQALWGIALAALGWFLRHKGILAPKDGVTPAPSPVEPSQPDLSDRPLLDLLKKLLEAKRAEKLKFEVQELLKD